MVQRECWDKTTVFIPVCACVICLLETFSILNIEWRVKCLNCCDPICILPYLHLIFWVHKCIHTVNYVKIKRRPPWLGNEANEDVLKTACGCCYRCNMFEHLGIIWPASKVHRWSTSFLIFRLAGKRKRQYGQHGTAYFQLWKPVGDVTRALSIPVTVTGQNVYSEFTDGAHITVKSWVWNTGHFLPSMVA